VIILCCSDDRGDDEYGDDAMMMVVSTMMMMSPAYDCTRSLDRSLSTAVQTRDVDRSAKPN